MTETEKALRSCERVIEMYGSNGDFKNVLHWMAREIYYSQTQVFI